MRRIKYQKKSAETTAMTTTAIALFGSRISPRFDCTQDFMLITSSESAVSEKHTETIPGQIPIMKIRRLVDLKVDTLLCGGIDDTSREHLRSFGIKIIANLKGKVEEAISCYVTLAHT
jgi:predicted Fe-Mo cluster-binding NifX family protein